MSNLLEKASILTTPTAYNDGKLLSVKPIQTEESYNVDSTDFTVDGTSGNVYYKDTLSPAGTSGVATITFNHTVLQGTRSRVYIRNGADSGYVTTYTTSDFSQGQSLPNLTKQGDISVIVTFTDGLTFGFLAENGNEIQIQNFKAVEIIDGDFDFTRNSSATRVASNGLIEDVQILSGNLVQNGDFSQEGAELVTNGDFATDSDWTLGTGWSIEDGVAISDGVSSNSNLVTTSSFYSGVKQVKMSISVTDYVSGTLKLYLSTTPFAEITSNGDFTFYTTADRSDGKMYLKSVNFNASIDNVSVKEVGQDWTLGSGFSIDENKLIGINANSSTYQGVGIQANKKYKIQFTVLDYVSGNVRPLLNGAPNVDGTNVSANGTYTQYLTSTSNSNGNFSIRCENNFNGSITNISAKEITDDTDLPRIDYTDGVGHILLEPQSTNVAIYSGNASQWTVGGNGNPNNTTRVDNQSSPDGETNASLFSRNTGTSGWFGTGNLSTTNGQTYTHSLFVKKGTSSTIIIRNVSNSPQSRVTYNIDTDTFTTENNATGNSLNYGNGWYRIEMTFEYTNATGSFSQIRHTLEDGKSMYVFGAQLEQQSYATSYIPTSGSTITRLGETLNNSGSSDLINSTEGVLYAEISALANDNSTRVIVISDGTNANRVFIGYWTASNEIRALVKSGNVTQVFQGSNSYDILDLNKIAFKFKENDFALWINGVEVFTDTTGITFPIGTLTQLDFDSNSSAYFYGKVKCVAVFEEALTDEELTCLTTI